MTTSNRDSRQKVYFQFFNEIGIISQLGSAIMEALLPPGFLISHFSVLNHLTRVCDGRTPLEIARAFQVPKTTMTHTLSGLGKARTCATGVQTRKTGEASRSG
ncbi:MAG: hypothetical protein R3D34_13310 [Nitratireductor sp.]